MKRKVLLCAGAVFFLVLLAVAAYGMFDWRFRAHPPVANYSEPETVAEARQQDLDYLLNLPQTDYSFSEEEEAQFRGFVRSLQGRVGDMSDAEFAMSVAQAAAITKNGHTNLYRKDLFDTLNSLPVRFFWFGDGLHVIRAHENLEELIGARVVSYEGLPPDELVARLAPYVGGNKDYLSFYSPYFFASSQAMHIAGLATSPDQVSVTLRFAGGEERDVVLQPERNATAMMWQDEVPLPILAKQETKSENRWRFPDKGLVTKGFYAKNPKEYHWTEDLPAGGFYVRLRLIQNQDSRQLKDWLTDLKEQLSKDPVEYLVLDVRSAPGGDYTKARDFARDVLELVVPGGKVYLLTDAGTFSAAIVTQAFALHAAGERGVVVGTPVGDDEQFWAESSGALELPNSGLRISVSTGYHDWENGCTDWKRCFWLNIFLGVAAGSLEPDIVAPLTYTDYAQGIDTTLQAVFEAEGITAVTNR